MEGGRVHLGLDPGGIVTRQLLLAGGRDQDVAVGFQNVPVVGLGAREAHDGAVLLSGGEPRTQFKHGVAWSFWRSDNEPYQLVVLQLLGVDAVRVVDGAVDLADAHALGAVPVQVPHGVQTHVAKALSTEMPLIAFGCRRTNQKKKKMHRFIRSPLFQMREKTAKLQFSVG